MKPIIHTAIAIFGCEIHVLPIVVAVLLNIKISLKLQHHKFCQTYKLYNTAFA